ncbi:aldose 1-epimerase [Streptomyces sp. NPDC101160]|uniref:aldose 1-epimerase n=1 Tax=Streptomyces sp. NPDC101160 TaxID=3366118 RepID=UPI003803B3D1
MTSSLWLHNDRLSVEIRPDKGADITSIVERDSTIDLLWRTPWGRRDLAGAPVTGDSQVDWLARYGGGWQQLVPNAGAERTVDGVRRGYHGEAAVVAWSVVSADEELILLTTDLITAPLRLTRTLRLDGAALHVRDTVRNTGDLPVPVMWVQHPGFGAPFIDEHCTLTTPARTVLTDAGQPGNTLVADTRAAFPFAPSVDGTPVDLRKVPGPGSGRSVFACLTDFDGGWYEIHSPTAGFGIRVEWDPTVFPHAWLWQECHASSGFPWHRRAYVVAVEPANVLPGDPSPTCPDRGESPLLPGGATWTSDITLSVIPGSGALPPAC